VSHENSNEFSVVPGISSEQEKFWLPPVVNPFMELGPWWATQTVTDVPENIMGWLVAQGFEVTNIRQDTTTKPPTNYFSVKKEGLRPQEVLRALCNSYTRAANEARGANQYRYNEVLEGMNLMVDSSNVQFDAQTKEQNAQSGVYLADLDDYMTEVETMISENQSQIVADALEAKTALGQMLTRLSDLETNATNNATEIKALFAEQETNLADFLSRYESKLAELDQNFASYLADVLSQISSLGNVLDSHISDYSQQFSVLASNYTAHASDIASQMSKVQANVNTYVADVASILLLLESDYTKVEIDLNLIKNTAGTLSSTHASDYTSVLGALSSDYFSHAEIARNFLINLGSTELARINEQFASNLSIQMQQLVSRGLSSSAIVADVTARNQRDRDEQIQLLNDRLNREKLDNQHRLYEQQAAMRARTLDGKDRLHGVQQEVLRYQASLISSTFALLNDVRNRVLAGKQAIFSANDANQKYSIEVSSNMYGKLQEIRQRTIDSVDRIYQLRDIFAKWKEEDTVRRYEQIQKIEAQFLEGIQRQNAEKQDIIKTQIPERNNLLTQLQNALTALMSGKERYATLLMQNASALAEHKHRAIVELMNSSVQRLEGWKSIADQNMKLMMYQLDERNKLLVGVYAFVERREDVAPEWKDMSQMIAGLGDSGGGWLTPN
jgi:hypothetical protein